MRRHKWTWIFVAFLALLAWKGIEEQMRWGRMIEAAKVGRAKSDMQTLEQAVKKFYTEHGEWPPNNSLRAIAHDLEAGHYSLLDPWGNPYTLRIEGYVNDETGQKMQRAVLTCQPPDGRPAIVWPPR